jgi:SAM-dependent methyltransferase
VVTVGTCAPAFRLSPVQRRYRATVLSKLTDGQYHLEKVPDCPLCGSSEATSLASHDRFGLPVGVVLCRSCGLVRSTPRLAASDLPAFYEEDYHGLHGLPAPDPSMALFRSGQGAAVFATIRDQLPERRLRVAEIGAGTGQVLREFAEAAGGAMLAGCEYASAYVDAGRSAGTDLRQGGPETLRDLAPFDVVILSHVVEHFPDPVAGLTEVRTLGDLNTLFYVEVPGLLTIENKSEYAYRFDRYLTLAHTFDFTLATLTDTLARSGFQLVRGDEQVRSVYRQSEPWEPEPDPANAQKVLARLEALGSWSNRLRQAQLFPGHLSGWAAKELQLGTRYRALRRRFAR